MTSDGPALSAQREPGTAQWNTRALIARHKVPAAGAAAVLLILLALSVSVLLGPHGGTVGDSTSCSQWGSSNQLQQQAYARLYLRQHGTLPNGATGVSGVEAAVNAGCMASFASDEEDNVTVLDAIQKNY